MILQYFKKKENKYKKIADKIYSSILSKSKELTKTDIFKKVSFDSAFEFISIILIFYLKAHKDCKNHEYKMINQILIQNFIDDLDRSIREIGVGDMSIGKYVKKFVRKFYYRIKIIDPILENHDQNSLINHLNSRSRPSTKG